MLLTEFFDYLQYEKRYSFHTVEAYKTDLVQFLSFLKSEFDTTPVVATPVQIRGWLVSLMAHKIGSKSVNRKISSIRSFYKYLELHHKLENNPIHKVTVPKIPKRLPVFVSESSIETLFDVFEFPTDFMGVRDRLILETFYCTGIRLSELLGLKHSDIDLHTFQFKVKGKGNKERIIPIVDSLVHTIKKYVDLKKQNFGYISSDHFFVTDKGKKVYHKFVYRVVNIYLSCNTTVSKRSPHVLRHSFATHMLNHGADINAIKDLLGHSSLGATEIYTHNTVEKIKSVYKQAHPKA